MMTDKEKTGFQDAAIVLILTVQAFLLGQMHFLAENAKVVVDSQIQLEDRYIDLLCRQLNDEGDKSDNFKKGCAKRMFFDIDSSTKEK